MTKYMDESTYLKEDHYKNPKEYFKIFAKKISNKKNNKIDFLDVGCATGSLINFLNHKFPQWNFSAIEPSRAMIKIAKQNNKKVKFYHTDIKKFVSKEKFDLISLFGVLGFFDFDDGKKIIEKLIRMLKTNGELFILSNFNEYNVDVLVNHRKYDKNKLGGVEGGWNIYSKKTISRILEKKKVSYMFYDFTMPFQILKKKNSIRSWTIKINKKHYLTNGLGLIINLKFLRIIKKC